MESAREVETALIVPVPEAETAVRSLRERLDPSAAWGVPAHVTVLYPFLPLNDVTAEVEASLRCLFGNQGRFDFALHETAWFGDEVLYCSTDAREQFLQLTHLVTEQWPDLLPYGGAHSVLIPHLTVGEGAPLAELRAAEAAVRPLLPISATAEYVALIAGERRPESWTTLHRFPLDGGIVSDHA